LARQYGSARTTRQSCHVDRIHFIHIPKTGGTALTAALGRLPDPTRFVIHDHTVTLAHIPVGEKVVFGIRDPVSRFVSAFNSRLRKGRPRYDVEWTPIQQKVFRRFSTPNQLAEALSASEPDDRELAVSLLRDMDLAAPLSHWLTSKELLWERLDDIVAILLQKELADDFERLKAALRLPPQACLPDDPVEAHRGAASASTFLSNRAVQNLAAWYGPDASLYEAACDARAAIRSRMAGRRDERADGTQELGSRLAAGADQHA
jgi:hypothetical protein